MHPQSLIPTPLRLDAKGKDAVEVNPANIAGPLDGLTQTHPALRKHLLTEDAKLRAVVNLYFNDKDVLYLPEKEQTGVSASDTLSMIPSIAGGPVAQGTHSRRRTCEPA
jgi:adenylyltransferase/sulfurtransferase